MRKILGLSTILAMLLIAFVLSGCQSMGLSGTSVHGVVPDEDRIPLSATADSTWDSDYVSLKYRFVQQGNGLEIEGVASLKPALTANFNLMTSLHMDVIFADAQGKVLGMQGLATGSDFDPLRFKVKVAMPVNTACLAFSYRGEVVDSSADGGGGPYYFWKWPIR